MNSCYASVGFAPSAASELIAIAEADGCKAGVGRVVPITSGVGELGGMFVLPEFRGRSVATKLVDFLLSRCQHAQLFCIPFAHLRSFYVSFGFLPVDPGIAVPEPIARKVAWCNDQYPEPVSLLVRGALPATQQRIGS
ncbi:GNAT family N-acetyltransferase [Pseudomarimonas arenosa]|uniref:GNAT family N-acetyltransferase n=1 Tax=Pseudomarimonas arenosa TaxID=2774145 RepID=UPI003CCD1586